MNSSAIHAKTIELAKQVLRMTTAAGAGHASSALSLAHIVTVLMYEVMRYDPKNPWHSEADRLVLSEGHAVPIVYAAYADLGGTVGRDAGHAQTLLPSDTERLRQFDSVLDGHPNPAEGFPFFDAATGSLGMGLSVAAGLGLAARMAGSQRRIYCLLGDGEAREGQVTEALDFIVDQRLTNICAIFSCNGYGQAGEVSQQQSPQTLQAKLSAAGWQATAIDGHEPDQIRGALEEFYVAQRPFAVVARTIKGWGVEPFQSGNWHGKPLPAGELSSVCEALDQIRAELKSDATTDQGLHPPLPDTAHSTRRADAVTLPPLSEGLEAAGFGQALEQDKLATRRAYGAALKALGRLDERIVVLDGDVSNSTFSEIFARHLPHRFFECKIAEQNMISTAVGLAAAGFIPFVNSFGKFIARAYDQIELAAISRANIKVVGSHSGLGPASDGPSQMALADLAFFRSLASADSGWGQPACHIFLPCDAVCAYRCTEMMANVRGLCYMRTHRPDGPMIYSQDECFEAAGCKVLREGSAATLVASGATVATTLGAWDELDKAGIRCTLLDVYRLPLAADPILEAAARTNGLILTVEDNYAGGVGEAVASACARQGRFRVQQMNVARIPKSARTTALLMECLDLSSKHICQRVQALIG